MKYCTRCGAPLPEGARFCEACGAAVPSVAFVPQTPVPSAEASQAATKAMVLGIVAAATAQFGVPAIILAALSKKQYARAASLGATGAKMTAARILRRVGMIAGIVFTVLWAIYLLFFLLVFGVMICTQFARDANACILGLCRAFGA